MRTGGATATPATRTLTVTTFGANTATTAYHPVVGAGLEFHTSFTVFTATAEADVPAYT
jgi:hypothetical protein